MNRSLRIEIAPVLRHAAMRRGAIFGGMLIGALLAFEIFNYATTSFALADILGDLRTAGLRWSTVLALAFCGMDFAGIARLFTPRQSHGEVAEDWYLFGAWLLAAAFNAGLTWWGVSVAVAGHTPAGSVLVGRAAISDAVPVVVAIMVWVIRVLIIGTFSLAGDSLFEVAEPRSRPVPPRAPASSTHVVRGPASAVQPLSSATAAEPSYHPVGVSARSLSTRPPLRQ